MSFRSVWVSLSLSFTVNALAQAPLPEPSSAREEFRALCRRFQESRNPFYGLIPERELRAELAQNPGGVAELLVRLRLGRELLQQGQPSQGIPILEAALPQADALGLKARDRFVLLQLLALLHLQVAAGTQLEGSDRDSASSAVENPQERTASARRASDLFAALLELEPENPAAAWLLHLARRQSDELADPVRSPISSPGGETFPRWLDRAPDLGLNHHNTGGGVVIDDFDGDGWLDLVISSAHPCAPLQAWRNRGHGGFENVSALWGLEEQLGGASLFQADFDNDGDLDLLVLRGAGMAAEGRVRNSLLRNDPSHTDRHFVDVTYQTGLAVPAYPTQTAAWADYDGDGDLDLYIGNESLPEAVSPSQLFRNNGGTFIDVAPTAGVSNLRFARGVAWGDYDNDGDPDLYVSNFGKNRLYRNQGDSTFADVAADLGVTAPEERSSATWFFDYDNDGDLDLFVADANNPASKVMTWYLDRPVDSSAPTLYRNENPGFTPVAAQVGLNRPLLPLGATYGDLDNDGWLDLVFGNSDLQIDTFLPSVVLRNDRGKSFRDVTQAAGFDRWYKGHSVALGDLDQDGDQDLFYQLGGLFVGDARRNALLENPGPVGDWITLRLVGQKANRFGLGARIAVRVQSHAGEERTIHRLVTSGGLLGDSSLQEEIGLGTVKEILEVRIHWPGSNTEQVHPNVEKGRVYRVIEGAADLIPVALLPFQLGRSSASPATPATLSLRRR